jgi:hypothetical protein
MPRIYVEVKHALERHVALERINGLLVKLKAEYGNMISELKETWNETGSEFSFKAMGMLVEGIISVTNDLLVIDGKIPIPALPFKGTIEKTIKEEANKLLIKV